MPHDAGAVGLSVTVPGAAHPGKHRQSAEPVCRGGQACRVSRTGMTASDWLNGA